MYHTNKHNAVLKISDALKEGGAQRFRAYHACCCINVGQALPDKREFFSRGGRCPVRVDEGVSCSTSLYPALQTCGMTSEVSTSAKRGFTLLELLVVILIIAILAAIAVPQYQKAVWRSRNAGIKALIRTVAEAQDIYYLEHGQYAANFSDLDIDLSLTPKQSEHVCGWAVQGTDSLREGKGFVIVLNSTSTNLKEVSVVGGWISGKYRCKYFTYALTGRKLKCISARYSGNTADTSFCTSIEHGINPVTSRWSYEWDLP